jgi:aryl-alcohol dehydrogenase-like predicted oxidoreductase
VTLSKPELPSRIGFGVSGVHGTPLISRAKTIALIEQAVSAGIAVFDTAPAYGAGQAEQRLGEAVKQIGRERVYLMTKAGLFSHGLAGRRRDFSPDAIEASVRASLKRLDVEGVDALFLHGPDPAELSARLFERLALLQRAGAFSALGVAGRGDELDDALQTGRFQAVMAPVHPFLSELELRRLQIAAEAGVQVIAIETSGDTPAPPSFPQNGADLYRLLRALRAKPLGRGRVPAMTGMPAALGIEFVSCVLATTSRPAHLDEIVQHLR